MDLRRYPSEITIFPNRDDYDDFAAIMRSIEWPEHLGSGINRLLAQLMVESESLLTRRDNEIKAKVLALAKQFAPHVGIDPDDLHAISYSGLHAMWYAETYDRVLGITLGKNLEDAQKWLEKALLS